MIADIVYPVKVRVLVRTPYRVNLFLGKSHLPKEADESELRLYFSYHKVSSAIVDRLITYSLNHLYAYLEESGEVHF